MIQLCMEENKKYHNLPHGIKPVLKFFLLVYILSAPFWILQLFINHTGLPLDIPVTDIVAVFTPLVSACILTYKDSGRKGVVILLSRICDYKKLNITWWVIISILPVAIFVSTYLLLGTNNYTTLLNWKTFVYNVPFLFIFFFLGAVGEEVGYTGYATDLLQKKVGAFWTSIIIGIPWIMWHYPSMLQQGRDFNFFLWGTVGTIAFRIIYVWLYNQTRKSLFACIFVHCLYNTGRILFSADGHNNPLIHYPEIHYSVIAILAIILVSTTLWWDQKH